MAIEKEQFWPTRVSWADNTGDLWQVRGLQRASLGALVPLLTVDEDAGMEELYTRSEQVQPIRDKLCLRRITMESGPSTLGDVI